jgi:hypothetical protein
MTDVTFVEDFCASDNDEYESDEPPPKKRVDQIECGFELRSSMMVRLQKRKCSAARCG